jgi:hypothetical protein
VVWFCRYSLQANAAGKLNLFLASEHSSWRQYCISDTGSILPQACLRRTSHRRKCIWRHHRPLFSWNVALCLHVFQTFYYNLCLQRQVEKQFCLFLTEVISFEMGKKWWHLMCPWAYRALQSRLPKMDEAAVSFGDTQKLLLCSEREGLSCVWLLESPDCRRYAIVDSIWSVASSPTGETSMSRNNRLFTE